MKGQTLVHGKTSDDIMTGDEMREWLLDYGLTIDDFACITGYDRKTITGWGKPKHGRVQHVPKVIVLLLDAWTLLDGPPAPPDPFDAGQATLVITDKSRVRWVNGISTPVFLRDDE